ncbi:MAG: mechanosensitive ion channel family protein [Methanomicrobiales archaeon]
MLKKVILVAFIILCAIVTWFGSGYIPGEHLYQVSLTLWTIAVVYLFASILAWEFALKQIEDKLTRYSLNKAISIISALVVILIVIRIWVPDTQSLIFLYGLLGAGIAISLQDVFRNFAGGILIITGNLYHVGDRIEVGNEIGDVMDIGIMYTTMMELRGWIDGDQPTGRLTKVPNGKVISNEVHNYTQDHSFLWDEIKVPVTYSSDWRKAKDLILGIVQRETMVTVAEAEREIEQLGEKYYLPKRMVEPAIYLTPTDNWIMFHVRYVTRIKERRAFRTRLSEMILETIQEHQTISISSSTQTVTVIQSGKDSGQL